MILRTIVWFVIFIAAITMISKVIELIASLSGVIFYPLISILIVTLILLTIKRTRVNV